MKKEMLKEIWKESFNDSEEYIDWYFKNIYSEKNLVTMEENGKIIGGVHKFEYKFHIGKRENFGKYLVGMGVFPEHRGTGIMENLLKRVFEKCKKNGEEIITLTPVNERIYFKYGFEYISVLEKYTFDFSELVGERILSIERITKDNFSDEIILEMINIYLTNMKGKKIYVNRSYENFKQMVKEIFFEKGILYLIYNGEVLEGYILLKKGQEEIYVKEMIYNNINSLKTIFYILEGYKNYFKKLEIIMPKNSELDEIFIEKKRIKKEIVNELQGRILLAKKFLEDTIEKIDKIIYIKVKDDILHENNNIYEIKNGEVNISTKKEWDMEIGIGALIALGSGNKRVKNLEKAGKCKIKKGKKEELELLFKEGDTYFNEY